MWWYSLILRLGIGVKIEDGEQASQVWKQETRNSISLALSLSVMIYIDYSF